MQVTYCSYLLQVIVIYYNLAIDLIQNLSLIFDDGRAVCHNHIKLTCVDYHVAQDPELFPHVFRIKTLCTGKCAVLPYFNFEVERFQYFSHEESSQSPPCEISGPTLESKSDIIL